MPLTETTPPELYSDEDVRRLWEQSKQQSEDIPDLLNDLTSSENIEPTGPVHTLLREPASISSESDEESPLDWGPPFLEQPPYRDPSFLERQFKENASDWDKAVRNVLNPSENRASEQPVLDLAELVEDNGNVTYSRNDLAQNFSFEIAKKLRIEPGEVEISWLSDCASFSFVLPSRFAAILLYHHSTGNLKNFLDFEIQDLHIGQYDWDNYLGLVPVTS